VADPEVKIGSTVWFFDVNHRVYPEKEGRHSSAAPIWREHWVRHHVIGETSRSWLVGSYPKADPKLCAKCPKAEITTRYALTELEVDERVYCHDNGWRIAERVQRIKDARILREVARIIGYSP
jgi:hypothetical protein